MYVRKSQLSVLETMGILIRITFDEEADRHLCRGIFQDYPLVGTFPSQHMDLTESINDHEKPETKCIHAHSRITGNKQSWRKLACWA